MRRLLLLLALWAWPATAQEFVVTFGGDVNFAQSRAIPDALTVSKFGRLPLRSTTETLARELTGDLNIVNVETVVSDREGTRQPKTFVFRSHPEAFRHLMDLGVNGFSLANNHAYDHGWQGLADTLSFFEAEDRARGGLLFAGVGRDEDALAPRVATISGVRVAFASIGIGAAGYAAREGVTGMASWRVPGQYEAVLAGLRDAPADLRILAIHAGVENQMTLDWGQRDAYLRAIREAGVNLVLGHHPHIVRGVEAGPSHAIFHSLGNLLFVGGAVRDGLPVGQDYGLLGKAYFHIGSAGPRLVALEAVPLLQVHLAPRPMGDWRAEATMRHLSALSRQSAGADGVAFTPIPGPVPRGAACFGGPYGPAALALCCRVTRTMECDLPDLM